MRQWTNIGLTSGVVTVRNPEVLEPGELASASDFELRHGDKVQLHLRTKDLFTETPLTGELVDVFYLGFEESADQLLAVTSQTASITNPFGSHHTVTFTTMKLYLANVNDLSSWTQLGDSYGGEFSRVSCKRRGNEYYLGNGVVNLIISEGPAIRRHGMFTLGFNRGIDDDYRTGTVWDEVLYRIPEKYTSYSSTEEDPLEYPKHGLGYPWVPGSGFETWSIPQYGSDNSVNGPTWNKDDIVHYFVTEYDETNDVESPIVAYGAFYLRKQQLADKDLLRSGRHIGNDATTSWSFEGKVRLYKDEDPNSANYGDYLPNVWTAFDYDQIYPDGYTLASYGTFPVPFIDLSALGVVNATATHYRIYRHHVGQTILDIKDSFLTGSSSNVLRILTDSSDFDTNVRDEHLALLANERPPVGGRIAQVAITETSWADQNTYSFDPVVKFPYVDFSKQGLLLSTELQRPPRPYVNSEFWGDVLIMDHADSLGYTYRGYPDYEPDVFLTGIATTAQNDAVQSLLRVDDKLLIMTKSGVQRLNFLLQEGASISGPEQSIISTNHGVPARRGHTAFSGSKGIFGTWLSEQSLIMTDGTGWIDACPDWSVATAFTQYGIDNLRNVVLVNDVARYRLLLYEPGETESRLWEFYYHETLLKDGRMTVMGPTPVGMHVVSATTGSTEGPERVFLLGVKNGKSVIAEVAAGDGSSTGTLATGQFGTDMLYQHTSPRATMDAKLLATKSSGAIYTNLTIRGRRCDDEDGDWNEETVSLSGVADRPQAHSAVHFEAAHVLQLEIEVGGDEGTGIGPIQILCEIEEGQDAK